jgi:hypothetical protein
MATLAVDPVAAAIADFDVEHMLIEMDKTGDTRIQWDHNNQAEVAKAEARFNELKAKGWLAYSVNKKGEQGEVMQKFDAAAERIILHSPMQGG